MALAPHLRRRAQIKDARQVEFSSGVPDGEVVETYRAGSKWYHQGQLGKVYELIPAHSQPGVRRRMRLTGIELVYWAVLPPEEKAFFERTMTDPSSLEYTHLTFKEDWCD